ncbi:hypothetical protein NDU88_009275 [Pleurodeles waltl]|uniref:Uncharacterized protein n=1 Tax=Pleurodeles waltl TaxID=8319 RepID=A0AAV7PU38_PLEWA|nr:hypothetical protein NDU88_009275 [Pleurodeles waltl]
MKSCVAWWTGSSGGPGLSGRDNSWWLAAAPERRGTGKPSTSQGEGWDMQLGDRVEQGLEGRARRRQLESYTTTKDYLRRPVCAEKEKRYSMEHRSLTVGDTQEIDIDRTC